MPAYSRPYALDNDADTAAAMLDCLAAILDPPTRRLLGPLVKPGALCLDLGAGNGATAALLADLAGKSGRVVAADVNPRHVREHSRVDAVGWDVDARGVPAGPWDLIHARLLLAHLPRREQILADAAAQLAAGGVLVVQEWGEHTPDVAVLRHPPGSRLPEVYAGYQEALLDMFRAFGNDPTWCARVAGEMVQAGLVEVATTVHARSWPGGTAGTRLPVLVSTEKQAELVQRGLSEKDLGRMRTLLADPATLLLGNLTWSTIGYKPTGGAA